MRYRLWFMSVLLVLSACGGGAEPAAQQPEPKPTVFDPLTDSIQRAEAVEDQAAEQRKQIEQAER